LLFADKTFVSLLTLSSGMQTAEEKTYRSVPHIRPPFCNLSTSRKHRGGLYAGSDILSHKYTPSSGATPRCWHRNTINTDR